jgi:transglutaminase-like putative cysteine protease
MTSRSLLARSAVSLLLSVCSAPAFAARLPEWARTIADQAPAIPEDPGKDISRTLLSELVYTVSGDGTWRLRYRSAEQAYSMRAGWKVGVSGFPFDRRSKLKTSRAWHLPQGESAEKNDSSLEFDVSRDASLVITDAKTRVIAINGIRKGSLVFFEFESDEKPELLNGIRDFGGESGTVVSRLVFDLPGGWKMAGEWVRGATDPVRRDGNRWIWELKDVRGPVETPLGPSFHDVSPLLAWSILPGGAYTGAAAGTPDWPAFSRWYAALAAGRDEPVPEIKAIAAKLVPAGAGFFEKVSLLSRHVRDSVRYLSIALGKGEDGFLPHPARDTAANLYGDCKDKGTLLRSLLGAQGIASWPVLVNWGTAGTVTEAVAANGFNHFIVAIAVPETEPVPDRFASSVVAVEGFGRVLLVDTTNEEAAIGTVPSDLAGQKALLVAAEGGRLFRIPEATAAVNRIDLAVQTRIGDDLGQDVTIQSVYRGLDAEWYRGRFHGSAVDYRKAVEKESRERWIEAVPVNHEVLPETEDGAFTETVAVRVPPPRPSDQAPSAALFPRTAWWVARTSLTKRTEPVVLVARDVTCVSRTWGVPEDVPTPEAKSFAGAGWAIETGFERTEGVLVSKWHLKLDKSRFEEKEFPELKKLWAAVSATAGQTVPLGAH